MRKYFIITAVFVFCLFSASSNIHAKSERAPERDNVMQAGQVSWAIPEKIWQAMQGKSWHKHLPCPKRHELAYLRIPFTDFEGKDQLGELIVARSVAGEMLEVFEKLKTFGFRIERMELVHNYQGNDRRSMAANNTSAFNCRTVSSGRRLSEHARGFAIDINPIQNPYVKKRYTSPKEGRPFNSAAKRRAKALKQYGLILRNGPVVKAFARAGWRWGGNWRYSKDYQHFSKSGR